jgi:hypothetical protein
MAGYLLTWLTKNLAVGYAPMSYDELDSMRDQGIDAIVNLCGEYSDLHEIEKQAGFDVFWLPIPDEHAPKMEEMENGLAWLDEAIYLGKKVLVHCTHGIGRTGTFVTAYLLRRGFSLKKAGKMLKAAETRANPSNFSQWWLLRKFGKKEGQLTVAEPTPENRQAQDFSDCFSRYEALFGKIDNLVEPPPKECYCDQIEQPCSCIMLELIEALYLNSKMNKTFTAEQRNEIIVKATSMSKTAPSENSSASTMCPLYEDECCLLHRFRPVSCRLKPLETRSENTAQVTEMYATLRELSREVCQTMFGVDIAEPPLVSVSDTISGKFIQRYFHYLTALKKQQ